MDNTAKGLHQLLKPVVESLGYELFGIEHVPGRHSALVRVYIDNEAGITLNDCERVSQQISGVLDIEDPIRGHYILEVSSPGLDRLLFTPAHFRRFAGNTIKMELRQAVSGRRKLTGKLIGMQTDMVIIIDNGKEYCIPFNIIGKTRLVPEYRLNQSERREYGHE
jgi:ribosome maturation factor RimP